MTQGYPPPSRRRAPNPALQQFAPVNVVMALIGQSRRRCVTYAEMMDKQAQGLVQLQMECQQMAGVLRQDPAGLHDLAVSLQACRAAAEMAKAHLDQQIQVELFLQGEYQRWLNGEPPTDLTPARAPSMAGQQQQIQQGNAPKPLVTSGDAAAAAAAAGVVLPPAAAFAPYQQAAGAGGGGSGAVDLKDPAAAAEFLARAQPMPVVQLPVHQVPPALVAPPPSAQSVIEAAYAQVPAAVASPAVSANGAKA